MCNTPPVSRLLDEIATKFRRLPPCFRDPPTKWKYPKYRPTKPEVRNPRWLPLYRKMDISQLVDEIATPFQRLTPIFGVQQLSGTIANAARCHRKSDFKDGGHQTGSTYISASRLDSNAVPTANPSFSGSSNSKALLPILPDETGSRFLKMAAAIPGRNRQY